MEKRLIIAMVLSMVIFLAFQKFLPQPEPQKQPSQVLAAPASTPAAASVTLPAVAQSVVPVAVPKEIKTINFESSHLQLKISDPFGSIAQIQLKEYVDDASGEPAVLLPEANLSTGILSIAGVGFLQKAALNSSFVPESGSVVSSYTEGGKAVTRSIAFDENPYFCNLSVNYENQSDGGWSEPFEMTVLTYDVTTASGLDRRFDRIVVKTPEKFIRVSPSGIKQEKVLFSGNPEWVGLKRRYFSVIEKHDFAITSVKAYRENNIVRVVLAGSLSIPAGTSLQHSIALYAGPNILAYMQAKGVGVETMLNEGVLSTSILFVLRWLHGVTHSWGLSIILISLCLYLLFLPLTSKSMTSMKKMQTLAPRIEEIRKTHKDNPQKMNKEVMELYKKNKVNPFGGCLPLLIQFPIFIALYQTLMKSVELKGTSFLWISDLALPDRTLALPSDLPLLGSHLNILPLFMGAAMFLQQKMSMGSATGQQAEQQKMISIVMPIMFCFIFYNFPSGLVLYWLTNTVLMIVYYYKTKHLHVVQE